MTALTATVVLANYFVIASLTAAYSAAWWLPAGIMGVGMFVLFGESTVWATEGGEENSPKPARLRWLTELAPPVAAALLVGCIAYRAFPLPIVLGGSLFSLVLFLFCGKLLLTLKTQLSEYHKAYRQNVLALREHSRVLAASEAENGAAAAERAKQESILASFGPRRAGLRSTELALQAEARTKREIFLSEHALASALQQVRSVNTFSIPTPSVNGHAEHHG